MTVAKTCQLIYILRIAHETLVYGVHRVFKCKRTLKLTYLDFGKRVFLPFGIQVYNPWTVAHGRRVAVYLTLYLVFKILQHTTRN